MSNATGKDVDNIRAKCDGTSAALSPMKILAISKAMSTASIRASSPTSITPATTVSTINPSSLQSTDTLTLAAMYHSSRRSRNNSPEKTPQLRASIQDLPPPPPIYSASDEEHLDQSSSAQPVLVSINTMRDSWNVSTNSEVNSSVLTSSNSSALAANPPFCKASPRQQRSSCTKKKHANIDWSELSKYSIEGREEPACRNVPVPEGDDSSSTAPLDDSEYSHVRSRSEFEIDFNFDEDQEKSSIPGADGCNPTELPGPPNKKNRRGSLSMEGGSYEPTNPLVPANDAPATSTSCSSDSSLDIYVSNNAYPSSRVSSKFDNDIKLNQSRKEKQSPFPTTRRKSLELEDLEDEHPLRLIQDKNETEFSHSELLRRKIQRLLLIRHCTKCSIRSIPLPPNVKAVDTGYFCPVTSRCAEGKALCAHIKTCKLDDCTYKKCLTTREVLGHYINCRDVGCKICGPVRSRDKRRRNQMNDDIEWRHANMLL
ncbi:hypothetical protein ACHAWT_003809 [Skeletonema menzelii]